MKTFTLNEEQMLLCLRSLRIAGVQIMAFGTNDLETQKNKEKLYDELKELHEILQNSFTEGEVK